MWARNKSIAHVGNNKMSNCQTPGKQTTLPTARPDDGGGVEAISESKLRRMYLDKQMGVIEIARELGVGNSTPSKLLDKYGIEKRSMQEQRWIGKDTRYRDKDFLQEHYIEKDKNMGEIAAICNCTRSAVSDWLAKHGIKKRRRMRFWMAGYHGDKDGNYPMLSRTGVGERGYVFIHRLVLVAEGHDPEKIYGDNEYNIHHRNGHKCDNRPENLELINRKEHGKKHRHNNFNRWTDDDIEAVIKYMLKLPEYHNED